MYDILIKNGMIVDGTGTPWERGDIGIKGCFIVAIGPSLKTPAHLEIDAKGNIVCPGFIDIHSHSDLSILIDPRADSKVKQGITTDISGNCGVSEGGPLLSQEALALTNSRLEGSGITVDWKHFHEYLHRIETKGLAINFASYVGHSQIRMSVMGYKDGKPSPLELKEMKDLVKESIRGGAVGLSTGLDQGLAPSCFADTEEIIELCKAAKEANPKAIYTSHTRNRQEKVLDAMAEFIQIIRSSGIRGQISHITPRFPDGDKIDQVLTIVEEARAEGLDVTCDVVVPAGKDYHTGMGALHTQVMPEWALREGTEQALRYLADPQKREEMKKTCNPLWGVIKQGLWDTLLLTHCRSRKDLEGKFFSEIAQIEQKDPWEVAYDILSNEGSNFDQVRICSTKHTRESDTRRALCSPLVMAETDRASSADYPPLVNFGLKANSFDAFPRFLQRYVRDEKVLNLEEAIKKITFMPAKRLSLRNRGAIILNFAADVLVINLEHLEAKATMDNPAVYPKGIDYVIVNGKVVVKDGVHTGELAGQVLRLSD
ncbi:MAG: D-aminoacylase [Candidatus Atribacteria bacterium]|nr:D-aminoacylase [Candidatus Atribacteria bacterium]